MFMAGADCVVWDLTVLGPAGPYRLTLRHSNGVITEYFADPTAALERQRHLEQLLIAARGWLPTVPEIVHA
jgi:hypothetical protein